MSFFEKIHNIIRKKKFCILVHYARNDSYYGFFVARGQNEHICQALCGESQVEQGDSASAQLLKVGQLGRKESGAELDLLPE